MGMLTDPPISTDTPEHTLPREILLRYREAYYKLLHNTYMALSLLNLGGQENTAHGCRILEYALKESQRLMIEGDAKDWLT